MTKVIIATALLFGFAVAGIANAADLGQPVYKTPPPAPPPPLQDWSGVYVGLEGGYGWGKQSADGVDPGNQFNAVFTGVGGSVTGLTAPAVPPLFFPDVAIPSIKQNGWLFGGFFGVQKQWGNWVLGIEGDIDGADIKGSGTSTASSVRLSDIFFNFPGTGGPPYPFFVGLSVVAAPPSTKTCRSTPRSMRSHRYAARSAGHLRRIG